MTNIAIVGAGRVGIALTNLILKLTDHHVILVDVLPINLEHARLTAIQQSNINEIRTTLATTGADIVVATTPFRFNLDIAKAAVDLGIHYVDFTEDVGTTKAILDLKSVACIIPQTGLAPGLVNYLGLYLASRLGAPSEIHMRVGALPQVTLGSRTYAITWSPEGLVNQYLNKAIVIRNGALGVVQPLSEVESVRVDGQQLEAFATSGGLGVPQSYAGLQNVDYKTLRYEGHQVIAKRLLAQVDFSAQDAINLFKTTFPTTREDVVYVVAQAISKDNLSTTASGVFYPHDGMTALELTTAASGLAVIELLIDGRLSSAGPVLANQIPMLELLQTSSGKYLQSCGTLRMPT